MPHFAGIKPRISPLCEVLCLTYIGLNRKNEAAAFRTEGGCFSFEAGAGAGRVLRIEDGCF